MKDVFENYLSEVSYKDWDFCVRMDGERPYLQIGFWERDNMRPEGADNPRIYQKGRKWMLSPYMTKSEVIQTAFKAVLTAEEHETREKFTYRGKPVFGPHYCVDALVGICKTAALDFRADVEREKKYEYA